MSSLLDTAIRALHIQAILLRNFSMVIADDVELGFEANQMGTQWRHGPTRRQRLTISDAAGTSTELVRFRYECGLRYVDLSADVGMTEPKVMAEFVAVFTVDYAVTAGAEISEEAAEVFGKRNVGYHVWPFWRELTQSHAARALLPLPVVPFYQAPKD